MKTFGLCSDPARNRSQNVDFGIHHSLVPNLIAAIYGMNFDYMPELQTRYGYYGALGLMLFCIIGLALNFKRKGWL